MRAIEEHLKLLSVFVRVHLSDLNTVALVVVNIFNRPGVAGAVLHTASSLIN